jgi:hypothetical protein
MTPATEALPAAAPSSEELVIGTVEVEEGISPVRQQESDNTDLLQQRQRYTSPTDSEVTTTASLLLSDLHLNEPRTSLPAPDVSTRFVVPNFSTLLRGIMGG